MSRSLPLLLLVPAVAFAQTQEVVQKVDAKLDAERAVQRNEDVEVLRRLLNKAAGLPDKLQLNVEALARKPNEELRGAITVPTAVGPFDGVYLPGAGVVFTLHVPAGATVTTHGERIGLGTSCNTCHRPQVHASLITHSSTPSLASCTTCHVDLPKSEVVLSDWDRVKQEVRGEKMKPTDKPKSDKLKATVCEPGDLSSLVAGVLAANARHVRHLPEKEGITVVVTFDEVRPTGGASVTLNDDFIHSARVPDATPASVATTGGEGFMVGTPPGFTPAELKALSLGDLHLKQGKHKEAAEAYAQALARYTEKEVRLSAPSQMTAERRKTLAEEFQKGVRDAMKNYAKALVLSDQSDAAKKALELATGFVVLEVTPTTVPAKSTAPAKLIVTLSKADLDAKDVKKAAKVERVNFPTEKK